MTGNLFITFEGGDGSGKSTQINKVKEFLESGILTQEQFDKCIFLTRGEANQLFADKYHIGIDLALKEFKNKT